jgi:hypothetical protein
MPTNITLANYVKGLRVNGVAVSYSTNTYDSYSYQFVLIPGFAEQAWYALSSTDYTFITQLFSYTKPNPSGRVMPEEFLMFFEIYWNGGGFSNIFAANFARQSAQTAAFGFR